MTNYKAIKGKTVQSLASDIAIAAGEGQIWFNTTSGDYKTIIAVGSWASGGDLNTARYANTAWGTQTAGLTAGGLGEGGSPAIADSEEYDGSTWTEGDNLNSTHSRVGGSMGIQTAAVLAGGSPYTASVEEYDGTSWAEVTDIPASTERSGNLGTLTAGLLFGGRVPGVGAATETYEYDGTNWTDGGDLPVGAFNMYSFGTQTAGVGVGGYPPARSETFDYDGTTWTDASADLGTARYSGGSAGTVNTAGLIFGGGVPPDSANVEAYDGISWSEVADIPAVRSSCGGAGTAAAALVVAGAPGALDTVYEWTFTSTTSPGAQNVKTITD